MAYRPHVGFRSARSRTPADKQVETTARQVQGVVTVVSDEGQVLQLLVGRRVRHGNVADVNYIGLKQLVYAPPLGCY